jgi:hypothetical protein
VTVRTALCREGHELANREGVKGQLQTQKQGPSARRSVANTEARPVSTKVSCKHRSKARQHEDQLQTQKQGPSAQRSAANRSKTHQRTGGSLEAAPLMQDQLNSISTECERPRPSSLDRPWAQTGLLVCCVLRDPSSIRSCSRTFRHLRGSPTHWKYTSRYLPASRQTKKLRYRSTYSGSSWFHTNLAGKGKLISLSCCPQTNHCAD